ncbi:redoxin domain-containing protein [Salinibacterium sp. UTAS2018]|uniref:redoxin domain-containing protein n=1 Tax=Salinibacterium sp. UTAS2018 TaxID=2508880 RepID=UPI001FEF3E0A|nr:redoxin domain-containing protein [Salinibacterium sp. UTAS2018]
MWPRVALEAMMTILPRTQPPALSLPLARGGTIDDLELGTGADGRFTLMVFYRGLHCPVCRKQLRELDAELDALREAGVGRVVAISMDTLKRASISIEDWELSRLPLAYGLSEEQARQWGLFISSGFKKGEPELFSEPGMVILDSDNTVFWATVSSMPFGRMPIKAIIHGIEYVTEEKYPARGVVAP